MVAMTGELGPAAGQRRRPVGDRRTARHRHRRRRPVARCAHDIHGHPPIGVVPRARPGAGRGGRDDRRRPDPEPRHARRQRRQRVTGGRHPARSCWRPMPSSSWARHGVSARSRPTRSGPAYRQTALAHDELVLRIRIPLAAGPRDPVPQGGHAPGPVDQQGRDGDGLALARVGPLPRGPGAPPPVVDPSRRGATSASPSGPSRRPRSVPRPPRPRSRAGRRRRKRPTRRRRRWPAS